MQNYSQTEASSESIYRYGLEYTGPVTETRDGIHSPALPLSSLFLSRSTRASTWSHSPFITLQVMPIWAPSHYHMTVPLWHGVAVWCLCNTHIEAETSLWPTQLNSQLLVTVPSAFSSTLWFSCERGSDSRPSYNNGKDARTTWRALPTSWNGEAVRVAYQPEDRGVLQ